LLSFGVSVLLVAINIIPTGFKRYTHTIPSVPMVFITHQPYLIIACLKVHGRRKEGGTGALVLAITGQSSPCRPGQFTTRVIFAIIHI